MSIHYTDEASLVERITLSQKSPTLSLPPSHQAAELNRRRPRVCLPKFPVSGVYSHVYIRTYVVQAAALLDSGGDARM